MSEPTTIKFYLDEDIPISESIDIVETQIDCSMESYQIITEMLDLEKKIETQVREAFVEKQQQEEEKPSDKQKKETIRSSLSSEIMNLRNNRDEAMFQFTCAKMTMDNYVLTTNMLNMFMEQIENARNREVIPTTTGQVEDPNQQMEELSRHLPDMTTLKLRKIFMENRNRSLKTKCTNLENSVKMLNSAIAKLEDVGNGLSAISGASTRQVDCQNADEQDAEFVDVEHQKKKKATKRSSDNSSPTSCSSPKK